MDKTPSGFKQYVDCANDVDWEYAASEESDR